MTDQRITDKGWTLHYTIGAAVAGPVYVGDNIADTGLMPDDEYLTVVSGRAPLRVNDQGIVLVAEKSRDVYPRALGMVWVSEAGGLSEVSA